MNWVIDLYTDCLTQTENMYQEYTFNLDCSVLQEYFLVSIDITNKLSNIRVSITVGMESWLSRLTE